MTTRSEQKAMRIITAILAVLILIPSLYGFGSKLLEFIALVRGDVDGVFAISPVANYLLASAGFFCLLLWATLNGMFHDIEAPKYDMLDQEEKLDQEERQAV
ncbi:hypothetical protein GC176_03220 [bacterium]|nr:hypothetical protein [bacterium]